MICGVCVCVCVKYKKYAVKYELHKKQIKYILP